MAQRLRVQAQVGVQGAAVEVDGGEFGQQSVGLEEGQGLSGVLQGAADIALSLLQAGAITVHVGTGHDPLGVLQGAGEGLGCDVIDAPQPAVAVAQLIVLDHGLNDRVAEGGDPQDHLLQVFPTAEARGRLQLLEHLKVQLQGLSEAATAVCQCRPFLQALHLRGRGLGRGTGGTGCAFLGHGGSTSLPGRRGASPLLLPPQDLLLAPPALLRQSLLLCLPLLEGLLPAALPLGLLALLLLDVRHVPPPDPAPHHLLGGDGVEVPVHVVGSH
mmetsp:Transcript_135580/g.235278  ORF Transcript_135580/g.235278 Transcript_135580/m.235278 type:complete len:272 (+) Transcript_135580:588-1403(+)